MESADALRVRNQELERAHEIEHLRRLEAEARASDLGDQARLTRQDLELHLAGIRYRLGHALILALKPSRHTLALPARMTELLRDGLQRWRLRRRRRKHKVVHTAQAKPSRTGVDPEIAHALASAAVPGVPEKAFAPVPHDLVRRPNLRVAAILDEFSWRCWQYEADFHPITPRNWRQVLETTKPDLLLIESAWSGQDGSWQDRLLHIERWRRLWMRPVIDDILAWCRRNGVPTVFHSKEDPTHFEAFLDLARACDFVFTSDADSVDEYRRRLGHARVDVLPFAAQPRIHNPVMDGLQRTRNVFFAGTWYAAHHAQRQRDAEAILRPAMEFGLDIFGRLNETAPPEYRWPEEYRTALRGTLPYTRMLSAYKLYRAGLNLNSIVYSRTMASRRLFELLASGTPVISSYARSISELLGDDVVLMSRDGETTRRHLAVLLRDDLEREKRSLRGVRRVLGRHTYGHRMRTLLDALGRTDADALEPHVAMLAPVNSSTDVELARANLSRQEYPHLSLALASIRDLANAIPAAAGSSVRVAAAKSWSAAFLMALEACDAEWIALANPSDYYGANYVTDCVQSLGYAAASLLGKSEFHERGVADAHLRVGRNTAYRAATRLAPWSLFVPRLRLIDLARRATPDLAPEAWATFILGSGGETFSLDPFNYVRSGQALTPPPISTHSSEPLAGAVA